MVQQFTAIEWGTESRPFPRLFDIARGRFDQQFWLPMLACAAVIVSLELLYRHTLSSWHEGALLRCSLPPLQSASGATGRPHRGDAES
jgi:hypothetical protein